MKVIHTISSIDKSSGGTSSYMQLLAGELTKYASITILTTKSPNPLTLAEGVPIVFKNKTSYLGTFLRNPEEIDLFHGNGLWQLPVHKMSIAARLANKPYIISPHGMLEPWALGVNKWKKDIALKLFQDRDLRRASCIHATASSEAENIRNLGFGNPLAVIPNGINLNEFFVNSVSQETRKKTMLFLSRIHPKKGIELLIEAWSSLNKSLKENWKVEIAGMGEITYIETLIRLIRKKNLSDEIKIIGPLFGGEKISAYQRCNLFVLPTYSENFGIVVAEALASRKPVITTKGTPWKELDTHHAGWWIDVGVEPLVMALNEALSLPESERRVMGNNGRKLVEEKYSIEFVAMQMITLYEWILGKGIKPDFVYL